MTLFFCARASKNFTAFVSLLDMAGEEKEERKTQKKKGCS
jgi:hypothetical protein